MEGKIESDLINIQVTKREAFRFYSECKCYTTGRGIKTVCDKIENACLAKGIDLKQEFTESIVREDG